MDAHMEAPLFGQWLVLMKGHFGRGGLSYGLFPWYQWQRIRGGGTRWNRGTGYLV